MKCKNHPKKYYTGNENTPLGRGYTSSSEEVGTKMKGKDGFYYLVSLGKDGKKRWKKRGKSENKML